MQKSVFDKYFSLAFYVIKNKKRIIIILTLVAVIGLSQLDFDSGIELMLPDKGNIHKIISFLRNSNLTNKVVISLSLISEDKDKKDLIDAVEQL